MHLLPILLACVSHTVLRPAEPLCGAWIDRGALYLSGCSSREIQRFDESTGRRSTIFTADVPLRVWDISDGYLVVLPNASTAPVNLTIVAPDGTSRAVAESAPSSDGSQVRDVAIRDGYVYWIQASTFDAVAKVLRSDGEIRRVPLTGGAVEVVAAHLSTGSGFRYAAFKDRLVYRTEEGVLLQPASGGIPSLLLPNHEVDSIAGATDDALFVTTYRRDLVGSYAQLLRVPWGGAPVDAPYETAFLGHRAFVTLTGVVSDRTAYVVRTASESLNPVVSESLVVVRDGAATVRYGTTDSLRILAADEEGATVWDGRGKTIDRLCGAVAPRLRTVQPPR